MRANGNKRRRGFREPKIQNTNTKRFGHRNTGAKEWSKTTRHRRGHKKRTKEQCTNECVHYTRAQTNITVQNSGGTQPAFSHQLSHARINFFTRAKITKLLLGLTDSVHIDWESTCFEYIPSRLPSVFCKTSGARKPILCTSVLTRAKRSNRLWGIPIPKLIDNQQTTNTLPQDCFPRISQLATDGIRLYFDKGKNEWKNGALDNTMKTATD